MLTVREGASPGSTTIVTVGEAESRADRNELTFVAKPSNRMVEPLIRRTLIDRITRRANSFSFSDNFTCGTGWGRKTFFTLQSVNSSVTKPLISDRRSPTTVANSRKGTTGAILSRKLVLQSNTKRGCQRDLVANRHELAPCACG